MIHNFLSDTKKNSYNSSWSSKIFFCMNDLDETNLNVYRITSSRYILETNLFLEKDVFFFSVDAVYLVADALRRDIAAKHTITDGT